jgi:hypothetical protein
MKIEIEERAISPDIGTLELIARQADHLPLNASTIPPAHLVARGGAFHDRINHSSHAATHEPRRGGKRRLGALPGRS